MPFEQIEAQKREYTDKYVLVDPSRPELARFRDIVGQVKTVNMSGRALVEFVDYHLNIGWYDIDPAFLKIVDKPAPKAAKPEGKKPAAKAEAKPAAAAKTPAAKAPAPAAAKGGKPSVADILAAARSGKPAAAGEAASAAAKPSTKPSPTPTAPSAKQPAKVDRSKMSVADMIAAARSGSSGGATAAPAPAAPVEDPAQAAEPAAETPPPAAPAAKGIVKVDRSSMSVDQMIAYCREHDAK